MYFDSENSQIKCTIGTKTFRFDAQIDEKNLWNFVFKIITVMRFLYVQGWKGRQISTMEKRMVKLMELSEVAKLIALIIKKKT